MKEQGKFFQNGIPSSCEANGNLSSNVAFEEFLQQTEGGMLLSLYQKKAFHPHNKGNNLFQNSIRRAISFAVRNRGMYLLECHPVRDRKKNAF